MNMQIGLSKLHHSEIDQALADLRSFAPQIRKLVVVTQFEDGQIAYIRAAADADGDNVLAFIGMLDFAKMGFFGQLSNIGSNADDGASSDVVLIEEDSVEG